MPDKLIFNPQTELVMTQRHGEIASVVATAPVRGRALCVTKFSRQQDPELFDFLCRFASGDIVEAALGDQSCERLMRAGLLVPEHLVPVQPQFRCSWRRQSSVATTLLPRRTLRTARPTTAALQVNPTLEYREDIRTLASAAGQRGPNPFEHEGAWAIVEHPDVALPSLLSLDEADRALFRRLEPGAPVPGDVDPELLRALEFVDVLVAPEDARRRRKEWAIVRARAHEELAWNRYAVIRGLGHPLQLASLRSYYRQVVENGHVRFGDPQVPLRYGAHNETMARYVHRRLTSLVSDVAGEPMKPSYVYFASYRGGATLKRHRDREQCSLSISLLLDYKPEPDDVSPWPLWLGSRELGKRGAAAISLGLGDGLIYRGTELPHWRDALPEGHESTSLFLHYVPEDFAGRLD